MIGSILLNVFTALIGMGFTFLLSIQNNVLSTSLIRSLLCALILFIAMFPIRWIFHFILLMDKPPAPTSVSGEEPDHGKGAHVDYVTPEGMDDVQAFLKLDSPSSEQDEFSPLPIPTLVSKDKLDPEELVKVIRHLKDDEGR